MILEHKHSGKPVITVEYKPPFALDKANEWFWKLPMAFCEGRGCFESFMGVRDLCAYFRRVDVGFPKCIHYLTRHIYRTGLEISRPEWETSEPPSNVCPVL